MSAKFKREDIETKYNGQNGNPLYLALDGKVYDVTESSLWTGGNHYGHLNHDFLENVIDDAPHGREVIEFFPVIGELDE